MDNLALAFWVVVMSLALTGAHGDGGIGSTLNKKPRTGVANDAQCGVSKGCFSNCKGDQCGFVVTWVTQSASTVFTFQVNIGTRSTYYASIGFSDDEAMGDDSCIDCLYNGGVVTVEQSWNDGDENEREASTGLSVTSGSFNNGILTCQFTRQNVVPGNSKLFDLTKDWILFLAVGAVEYEDGKVELEEHDYLPWISDGRADLQSYSNVLAISSTKPIVKAHASFMVLAWMLLATFGMVFARYYKQVWPDQKIAGKALWFQLHWPVMALTTVFTFLGFLLILIHAGGELDAYASGLASAHGVLGVILFVLSLLNPIGAFFRPGPDHKYRWLFKYVHQGIATISQVFAVLVMIGGTLYEQAWVNPAAFFIVIGFVVWNLIVEIILVVLTFCISKRTNPHQSMDMQNGVDIKQPSEGEDRTVTLRKIILVIHMAVVLSFTFSLIGLIVQGE